MKDFLNFSDPSGPPQSFFLLTIDLFNYIYYMPLMVTGPFMTYDQFEGDLIVESPEFRRDHPGSQSPPHLRLSFDKDNRNLVVRFLIDMLRMAFWGFLTEAITYRMYFGVLLKKTEFLR